MNLPHLTLILGGAASGKSVFAENLALASAKPLIYIATAQAIDDEMVAKIAEHQARRGTNWRTVEAPLDPARALLQADPGDLVLLDCVSFFLSNHLLGGGDLDAESEALVAALLACPAQVICVSNEVGMSVVPESRLGRQFRAAQGRLNQQLATRADLVVLVAAGLPLTLKGQLPS